MSYLKKVFFLGALFAIVALAPKSAEAAADRTDGQSCDSTNTCLAPLVCSDGICRQPAAADRKAGEPCDLRNTCVTNLSCDPNRAICIPNKAFRKIGTFCRESIDCTTNSTTLRFTCDKNNQWCVGATNNMSCGDTAVNSDGNLGKILPDVTIDKRCGDFLVCDATKGSICVNDFGQGKVPSDKLGDTATDIRDQIRNIINIALGFLGVAGVIVTLYGGFTWMTAFGDDEKVGKAKKTIVAGIIGIIIIGVAWTIVSYVLNVTRTIS